MFPAELIQAAEDLSERLNASRNMLVSAESCTGGLIAALITELSGSSAVFERGFVTYSNDAKTTNLGVDAALIVQHGAVSAPVAKAMASGALEHSKASISVAVTGVAGPNGGSPEKPVGLVHIASAINQHVLHRECRFGDIGRQRIRLATVAEALDLVTQALDDVA